MGERTDDEIRIKIALFMGWKWYNRAGCNWLINPTGWQDEPAYKLTPGRDDKSTHSDISEVPPYLTDLNAVREVEAELERRGKAVDYAYYLWTSLNNNPNNLNFHAVAFTRIHATAREKCAAILAVIEQARAPVGEGETVAARAVAGGKET